MSGDISISPGGPNSRIAPETTVVSTQATQSAVEGKGVKSVAETNQARGAVDSVEQARASAQQLQSSIEQLNEFMKQGQRSLAFSVDESADEVVVRVTDRETQELVRQIPSKEALELREHLDSVLGLLFSKRV